MSRLIAGKSVQLEPFEQDKYDRMIATVYRDDLYVNAEIVRQGHAWAYRKHMKRGNAELCALEDEARKARRGLWSLPKRDWVAPWEWRHRKKVESLTGYSHETAADCIVAVGRR